MEISFLENWVHENRRNFPQTIRRIKKYEDQLSIIFHNFRFHLHLNLTSENGFCFFSRDLIIPFRSEPGLNLFNKYLQESRISGMELINNDRLIKFKIETRNLILQQKDCYLILELIPHQQNLILCDTDDQIIDVLYRKTGIRKLLPGKKYVVPDSQVSYEYRKFEAPYRINDAGKIESAGQETDNYPVINAAFRDLYFGFIFKKKNERSKQKKISDFNKQITKKEKKIEKLKLELDEAGREKEWKETAELLKANFQNIKRGMESITLTDYYKENYPELEIKLDPAKDVAANVEYYFKKYKKAVAGRQKISEHIRNTKSEILKLNEKIDQLDSMEFFLESKPDGKDKKQKQGTKFRTIIIDEDWEILIGRNNRENDLLTTKIARSWDWWFHSRIYRGSHIILRNLKKQVLPDKLKIICCRLAAYYSKARGSINIPVDYTEIKYVRKPRGSDPGKVVYSHQKTLFVDPLDFRSTKRLYEKH